MPKTLTALALALALLLTCAPGAQPARAETYTARSSVADATPERLHNIALAARAVNGVWVPSGSAFSFNATLEPRTPENGWLEAPGASGEAVVGGGAEQAAATLYQTLSLAGGVTFQDLVPDDGGVDVDAGDLYFENNGPDLTLEMWIQGDALCCAVTADPADEADAAPAADWEGAMLPPAALLAASASLVCGGGQAAVGNAILAADSVYDTTLCAGDSFSFNDTVGPRVPEHGYRNAPDGRGETVCGGGVDQLASVIWLAVQRLKDVSILEKATYGAAYAQDYVQSAADALRVDEGDFAFRYNGAGSLTLFTYMEDGVLYCDIYRQ